MKKRKIFAKHFGLNEYGLADIPAKFSNVKLARLSHGPYSVCDWCFPNGFCHKMHHKGPAKNWKKYRKTHWKTHK